MDTSRLSFLCIPNGSCFVHYNNISFLVAMGSAVGCCDCWSADEAINGGQNNGLYNDMQRLFENSESFEDRLHSQQWNLYFAFKDKKIACWNGYMLVRLKDPETNELFCDCMMLESEREGKEDEIERADVQFSDARVLFPVVPGDEVVDFPVIQFA
jgi:hypothetical protein